MSANSVNDDALECVYAGSLSLDGLELEISADPTLVSQDPGWLVQQAHLETLIQALWPHFVAIAQEEKVFDAVGVVMGRHTLEIELTWTGNALMQTLNRDYREKDAATDVLTFTLLADAPDPSSWLSLPVLQLGSIFISIDWAKQAIQETPDSTLEAYVLERFVHGLLHLHGQHHDTMDDYHRVVGIQKRVLEATYASDRG